MAFTQSDAPQAADPSPPEAPSKTAVPWRLRLARWGVLLLLALAAASAYLTRHCLAVANTEMQKELGFNNEQFGYLYSAFAIGYMVFQVPGGWLGQRLGTRITLPLLSVLWSIATVATALVTSLPALIGARLGFGLAQAGLVPIQAKVVNDWFPAEMRGTASSVIVMAMSVGAVASLSLTSWLMTYYKWRTVFHAYSLVGVAWAVLFYTLFRARPAEVKWLRDAAEPAAPPDGTAASPMPEHFAGIGLMPILMSQNMWALAIQMFFKAAGYNLLVVYFPAFLEYAYGTPAEMAGTLASWSLIALVFGSLLGGRLVDRLQRQTGNKRISRCGVALVSLLLTAVMMWAATYAATGPQAAGLIAAAAFLSGIAQPCPWAAGIDIGGRNSAVVMGCLNIGACLPAIFITPPIGRLIDHIKATQGDWNQVVLIHAAFYLASALCWLAVDPDRTFHPEETPDAV